MTDQSTEPKPRERIARCGCGELTATCQGEPVDIYACSCVACQQLTGSAFSYASVFPASSISVQGERRYWRRTGDSGRWISRYFCPTCGVTICFDFEALPGMVGVPAGCFSDPKFAEPKKLYWSSRKHDWLALPHGTKFIDTQ